MSGAPRVAVIAARPSAPTIVDRLRRHGIGDITVFGSGSRNAVTAQEARPQAASALVFHGETDTWRVHTGRESTVVPVVILADAQLDTRLVTGSCGRTLYDALESGPAPYLGVATHGFPNLFFTHPVATPASEVTASARADYIGRCVAMLARSGNTRMEVRRAVQAESARREAMTSKGFRSHPADPDDRHFDLTVPADRAPEHEYSGPALLDAPGYEVTVTATLNGHPDPIDGRYHWYGRLTALGDAELPDPGRGVVRLSLPGGDPAAGRLQERDPWGNLRIAGIGRPPFPLAGTDIR